MEADDLSASRVGTVLCDKWTLERLLGVGGMAAVYAARHRIGRLDAIKILHPEYARSEQVRARFEQEAHVLNRFHHPGAVEVRDLEKTPDGAPFIVMELLEGKSLSTRVREQPPITVEETLRIADETLDVLAAAHEQKIIHRDIKPDNLFLLPNGSIKVLDFGIAQLRSGAGDLKTKTGTTLGTVAYMPQEQVRGLDIDVRADIYSVGATMFRLLVGRCPHQADSEVELLMKVMTEPAPRLATVLPELRADVARIVDRALAFDRDARYPDARSMQTDVRAARGEASASAPIASLAAPQSAVPTRTPQHQQAQIAGLPTMAAAPGSALLAEAAPVSRKATNVSAEASPVPSQAVASQQPAQPVHSTRISASNVAPEIVPAVPASLPSGVAAAQSGPFTAPQERKRNELFGVPLLWIILAAVALLLLLFGLLAGVAGFALFRGKEAATTPTQTSSPTTAPPNPWQQQQQASPEDSDEPPPPPHHGPPPGKGKHKHKDEW